MALDLRKLYHRFHDRVWQAASGPRPLWRRALWGIVRLTVAVLRDMREGRFDERAASLSYTTLLSFAPLLAVMFSVLKGLGGKNVIEPFLKSFLRPLGASADEVTQRLVEFVEKIQVSLLGVVGVALLIWGLIAMMQKIEEAFNDIWRVRGRRALIVRVRDYLSVLIVGPLFLFLSMGMTATARYEDFAEHVLHINISGLLEAVLRIVPYLLFMLAFACLYMFMPNTRVKPWPALGAGLVVGIVWKVLGIMFGVFVVGSSNYAVIYSAFAAMALLMVWIYAGWMTVLAGAAVCYYLQYPSNQPLSRRMGAISPRLREKLALQFCAVVGSSFYDQAGAPTLAQVALRMKLPELVAADVAADLIASGIVAVAGGGYIPGRPFDATSVEDALKDIRKAGEGGMMQMQRLHAPPAVEAAMKIIDKGLHRDLGKLTLKQLALGRIET